MTISQERAAAVAATVARVRAIERREGVTRAALAAIEAELVALGRRAELFPFAHFPVPADRHGEIYRLSEDADRRFALYASVGRPGKAQPPHNHTTWACIAGVTGVEINRLYRIDAGGRIPGPSRLTKVAEIPVGPGDSIFLGPDDVHDICVAEPESAMHLHLYGLGLPRLDRRLRHDLTAGTCEYFPVFSGIPRLAG